MQSLLLLLFAINAIMWCVEIEYIEKSNLEMNSTLIQIKYKDGFEESIIKDSNGLYKISAKQNDYVVYSSHLSHEQGRGVYDRFKALYKERKWNKNNW